MKRTLYLRIYGIIIILLLAACDSAPLNDTANQQPIGVPVENVTQEVEITPENNALEEPEPSDDVNTESNAETISTSAPTPEITSEPEPSATPSPAPTDKPSPVSELPPTTVPPSDPAPTQSPTLVPTPTPDSELQPSNGMTNISITISGTVFSAKLYDNDAVNALLGLFPLTLNMSELNGNEKYYYLSDSLPTDSQQVGSVNVGDLMLYGSDCLVLFYESFATSYSYTKIGYIEDVSGLAGALGRGDVQVTFAVED